MNAGNPAEVIRWSRFPTLSLRGSRRVRSCWSRVLVAASWLARRAGRHSLNRSPIAGLIAAGRLGDALALIRDLLPPAQIEEAVDKAFADGAPLPDSIRQAADFPWRAVVTTAFDDQWARALAAATGRRDPLRVLVGIDASARAQFGGPDTPLLHLCGRRALPKSLCVGPADARLRLLPSAGIAWLDQLRRRRSLVPIGFRPTDPDLVWLTSWLAAHPTPGGAGPHYL